MNTDKIKITLLGVLSGALKIVSIIPKPILAIFAPAIRHVLLKIMKCFSAPDDPRPAMSAADQMIDKILPSVFRFFKDSKFRKVAGFEKLDIKEHDRIFNELEIAAISLCLFCLEQRDIIIGQDYFHFWENVRKKIPQQFEQIFLAIGVDKENAKLMKKLVLMRHEEYVKISSGSRQYFEEQNSFEEYGEYSKDVMTRVQAVAVGASGHILRGKLEIGHGILRVMRQWLFPLDFEVTKFISKL
jgi:hypothetical protein